MHYLYCRTFKSLLGEDQYEFASLILPKGDYSSLKKMESEIDLIAHVIDMPCYIVFAENFKEDPEDFREFDDLAWLMTDTLEYPNSRDNFPQFRNIVAFNTGAEDFLTQSEVCVTDLSYMLKEFLDYLKKEYDWENLYSKWNLKENLNGFEKILSLLLFLRQQIVNLQCLVVLLILLQLQYVCLYTQLSVVNLFFRWQISSNTQYTGI